MLNEVKATFTKNEELNGIEITFDGKPAADIRDALKADGFRWHRQKKIWYAKNTAERLELAETITGGKLEDRLGGECSEGYFGATRWDGKKSGEHLYGAELSKAIRQELRVQGCASCSVRVSTFSGGQDITVTVKTSSADYIYFDTFKSIYTVSDMMRGRHWIENADGQEIPADAFYDMSKEDQAEIIEINAAKDYKLETGDQQMCQYGIDNRLAYSDELRARLKKIDAVINTFRYDDSNGMVDYFDTNFYYSIDIKRQ